MDDHFGRLFHIPFQLSKLGHNLTVIALDYKRGRTRQELLFEGVRFVSIPVTTLTGFILMIPRIYSELGVDLPDVLIASGDIYIGGLTALMAFRLRKPWIFDVYDDYRCFASARIPGMKYLFWKLVSSADHVIAASKPLEKLISNFTREITVVENGVDLTLFRPLEKDSCRRQLDIPKTDVVIGFFGSIAKKRGIEILLEAIQLILPQYPNIRVLLAGKKTLSIDLKKPYIDYRGMQPQSSLPVMINACDVITIPYEVDAQVAVSNPCKVAEYLACRVPVVVTEVSNMSEVFALTPEVLATPGSDKSLADALQRQITKQIVSPLPSGLSWSDLSQRVEQVIHHVSKYRT